MLKNAYPYAKIGFDPAENEPRKECCVVAVSGLTGLSNGSAVKAISGAAASAEARSGSREAGTSEPYLTNFVRILSKFRQILAKFS